MSNLNKKDLSFLQDKKLAGGKKTKEKFSEIFKINSTENNSYKINAISWNINKVELEILANKEKILFIIEENKGSNNCFLNTKNLSIYYQGQNIPKNLEMLFNNKIKFEVDNYTINKLGEIFLLDPDLGNPDEKTPTPDSKEEDLFKSKALLSSWGSKDTWYNFFASAEISRCQLDSLDFFDNCTFIQHCDQECVMVSPQLGCQMIEMVHYPWKDRIRNLDDNNFKYSFQNKKKKRGDNKNSQEISMYMTDLNEYDVIMGKSSEKLIKALEDVSKKELDDFIFCSSTCVPIISGEDTESIVKRYKKISKTPILFLTCTSNSMENVFHNILVKKRLEFEKEVTPQTLNENRINLIGYPFNNSVLELKECLKKFNIIINTYLLPHLDIFTVKKYPLAKLNVIYPNNLWNHLYNQLTIKSKINSIYPITPYGIKGTKKWLMQIITSLKIKINKNDINKIIDIELLNKYEQLKKEANNYKLGFIIDSKETFRLLEPGHTWGIPLIPVIEEMGFNIVVYIYVEDKISAYNSAKAVNKHFKNPEKQTIKAFNTPVRLDILLKQNNIDAIYSDYFFDWRITQSSKSQFSLQVFEMGINGAIKTLERLLDICKLPFYKRYGKYLNQSQGNNKTLNMPQGKIQDNNE